MNGLEALDNWYNTEQPKPVEYCFHYNIIRKELKVLNLLKEKKVDLAYIQYLIAIEKNVNSNFLYFYNYRTKNKLTLEEATLIVEWLKGENKQ